MATGGIEEGPGQIPDPCPDPVHLLGTDTAARMMGQDSGEVELATIAVAGDAEDVEEDVLVLARLDLDLVHRSEGAAWDLVGDHLVIRKVGMAVEAVRDLVPARDPGREAGRDLGAIQFDQAAPVRILVQDPGREAGAGHTRIHRIRGTVGAEAEVGEGRPVAEDGV
ncbi:hypothetical protein GYMLUDRAFT_70613 [Collybiopsis luxurians FD-317 M1]|nr:hypothetical protein GYMLUDRAFT_70613 [Collybiopsis luxurians FD-317 M1]